MIVFAEGEGRSSPASVFHEGQEVREEDGSSVANVALLFQGCGIDGADVLTLGVLQRIVGAGNCLQLQDRKSVCDDPSVFLNFS